MDSVLWNRHYYYYYYYYYHYHHHHHHHHHHHRHCYNKKNNIFGITFNLSQLHTLCCCTHSTVQATASTRAAKFRVVSLRASYVGTVNQTCRARLGRLPLPYTGESSWGNVIYFLRSYTCCTVFIILFNEYITLHLNGILPCIRNVFSTALIANATGQPLQRFPFSTHLHPQETYESYSPASTASEWCPSKFYVHEFSPSCLTIRTL